jgi:arylsulfatase A-like enzyme
LHPPSSLLAKMLAVLASFSLLAFLPTISGAPNILFVVGESTDGRLLRDDSPIPLPNVNALKKAGVWFDAAYSNSPVCAPSRSSFWSGRAPHKIPHSNNGFLVKGVWNNYEGLTPEYMNSTLDALLAAHGYDVELLGKMDRTVDSHTLTDRLESLTHNVDFPFNISGWGGWNCEGNMCSSQGFVGAGGSGGPNGSLYAGDWKAVKTGTDFIRSHATNCSGGSSGAPWFTFQGTNIVHPAYSTNQYWYDRIDPSRVTLPTWAPLEAMHPCDVQSSMLKGCTPPQAAQANFSDPARLARVIRIHYATLAEWDAMLGEYIAAVRESGQWECTTFVVAADHGDLHMEHRSFYKMSAFEGSAHVPLIVAGAGVAPSVQGTAVATPVSLLDVMPTVLALAGAPGAAWADGYDLGPFLSGAPADPLRPSFVVSQNADSDGGQVWFMVRHSSAAWGELKMIVWGSGAENPLIVYNLTADPDELDNVADTIGADALATLDAALRSVVDYPSVAHDVAEYGHQQFQFWANKTGANWTEVVGSSAVRWSEAFQKSPILAKKAFVDFYNGGYNGSPAGIKPCRGGNAWPPAGGEL